MTDNARAQGFEVLVTLTPSETRKTYWLLTDGPDSRVLADAAVEAVRSADARYAAGAATLCMRRPRKGEVEALDGYGLDLRGAVTEAEVVRRASGAHAPQGERNVYAGYGDKQLETEIRRCHVGSQKEWPHHRDHTLRTASDMQRELDLRRQERLAAPEEEAEASPAPGM